MWTPCRWAGPCEGHPAARRPSLRSSCFTIQRTEDGFDVTTLGYGHGVGLSQCGAQAMAAQGQSCAEILSWYFPGTSLEEYAG